MRDQGNLSKGVKRFAYGGANTGKNRSTDSDWDSFTVTKPIKETKELGELSDTWSIRKNVSLGGGPSKPQGSTVLAPPTGTGFYSRHGQHHPTKITDEFRSSPGLGQSKSSFSLNQQRSGYSYSKSDPSTTSSSSLPMLASSSSSSLRGGGGGGGPSQQYQNRHNESTQPMGSLRNFQGGGGGGGSVMTTRSQTGMQKPSQLNPGSQHHSGNSKTSGTGNQWSGF